MARRFAPEPGDDEAKALIARRSTKELIRDLRRAKVKLGRFGRKTAEWRAASKTRRWITAELLGRYPAALQAIRAARVAAITKTELRGLDYDHIMIDAIPASERGSDMPPSPRNLSAAQKKFLITLLGWHRENRARGLSDRPQPRELEGKQINTARSLVRYGYLRANNRAFWFDFRFTEQGLCAAEQLYADLGLDANVIYLSEALGPADMASPDNRPAGRVTQAVVTVMHDPEVFQARISSYGLESWACLLCDDGHLYTDRFVHWQWHMRLAATVDAIDWASPVVRKGNDDADCS